ncbi:MAG: cytidyltransferase-related enzyme [Parcubacteria group bacterium Greene0714_7]|nr:MAG: cytidyltransferase-related enzyme [Parcubacteria group bacterium Greene0714_7]
MKKTKDGGVVAVSGGFDPIHIGHVRMFKNAKKLGKKLVVILNNDNWLMTKKGFVFMTQNERKEILLETGLVDKVVITSHTENDPDRSVNRELAAVKPAIFANGGDRGRDNTPEMELCKKLGIEMVFSVGKGGKMQSSSWLTDKTSMQGIKVERPWGKMVTHVTAANYWVKTITVKPNEELSLQSHTGRDELWVCVTGTVIAEIGSEKKKLREGDFIFVAKGTKHRLSSKEGGAIVEVALGNCREEDIIRYEDKYGRT